MSAPSVTPAAPFVLPDGVEATEPAEVRGTGRDDVRLLVASPRGLTHARFADLPGFLRPGDLLVVNNSATLAAAVDATRADGRAVTVHFATDLGDGGWVVELRPPGRATGPVTDATAHERIALPAGAWLTLDARYPDDESIRLWRATVSVEGGVETLLATHGRPISYAYVPRRWPLAAYQTVFATIPGSAEMPSAARPFTTELVTRLVSDGITVAPVTLHTGVSSPEAGEPPLPERYAVPRRTAALVNLTRNDGGRVIAVGTTVTRALETAAAADGTTMPSHGWTDLVLGDDRPARVVDGLISGWHAPGASHLDLLAAVAGHDVVDSAYGAAVEHRYRWHEFGDSTLLFK
jgi:S-adenosylmethionine:tRNA ribosyltransferase-isomerase